MSETTYGRKVDPEHPWWTEEPWWLFSSWWFLSCYKQQIGWWLVARSGLESLQAKLRDLLLSFQRSLDWRRSQVEKISSFRFPELSKLAAYSQIQNKRWLLEFMILRFLKLIQQSWGLDDTRSRRMSKCLVLILPQSRNFLPEKCLTRPDSRKCEFLSIFSQILSQNILFL